MVIGLKRSHKVPKGFQKVPKKSQITVVRRLAPKNYRGEYFGEVTT